METFNYDIKKKKESCYIKFSFYVLLICGIIAAIWGVYQFNHQNKILNFGKDTTGLLIEKGLWKTSKKSASPSYFIRFECIIDSVKYNITENVSKEAYDTIKVGQKYVVKFLANTNPIYNTKILLNQPIDNGNGPY